MRYGGYIVIVVLMTFVAARCEEARHSDTAHASERTAEAPETGTASYDSAGQVASPADTLHGEVFFSGEALGDPTRLMVQGSYLLVGDQSLRPPIHVLDAETGRYLGSAGRKGQGPGEFSNVGAFVRGAANGAEVGVYDGALRRLTRVDLRPLAQGKPPVPGAVVPAQLSFTLVSVDRVNDSLLVATGFMPEGRLALLRPDLRLLRYVGPDPPGDADVPVPVRQHAYQRWVRYHPAWDVVLVAYFYADLVEAYRLDGTRVWAARGPQGFDPIYDVLPYQGQPARATRPDTRYGYIALDKLGEDRVLGLFVGREDQDPEHFLAHEARLFDAEGRMTARFPLSPPAYTGLAGGSDGCFFTIVQLPEPAVMRYCVPDDAGRR